MKLSTETLEIEIENILEKYSILGSEIMATSHQFHMNTTCK